MIDTLLHDEAPAVTRRMLRQFAGLSLVILGAMAAWQWWGRGHLSTGAMLGALAIVLGVIGLAKPEAIRPVFATLMAITRPIGLFVSVLLLGFVYYGVFTPIGLFFKLIGRDPLERSRRKRESHWSARPAVTDIRSYLRQS